MPFSFDQICHHLTPSPPLQGFEAFSFVARSLTLDEALDLRTCWSNGKTSLREYMTSPSYASKRQKVQSYAANFRPGPVNIICLSASGLHAVWPEQYDEVVGGHDQSVLKDGNHRVCALAELQQSARRCDNPLIGYLGTTG